MPNAKPVTAIDDGILLDGLHAILTRNGAEDWQVAPGEFWCYVQPPQARLRVQGWKLHISATPLSAPLVLARAADVLVRNGCVFKFATTLTRVTELVSARCERSGGGKFITVYPDVDGDGLRDLAEQLHQATDGLPGPGILSDRPYRPGSLVYYRYGAFSGAPMLGNDGVREGMLISPDGSLVVDQRKAWFAPPAWAPLDPFASHQAEPSPALAGPVLLNGRYVVEEAVRHAFKGGVFRAVDNETGARVIIKQARPHVGAKLTGQDARDALRYEARMLADFAHSGLTPKPGALFEQQGDMFLAQEAITGITLRRWVFDHLAFDADGTWGPPPASVHRMAQRLVDLVELVHRRGLVVQDLSPNNVMVTDDEDLRLIDLELVAEPGRPARRGFTPGYEAPERRSDTGYGPAPAQATDLYGLGATLFQLVTGVDPLLPPDAPATRSHDDRVTTWLAHLAADNAAARSLAPVILGLMCADPARRLDLDTTRRQLVRAAEAIDERVTPRRDTARGSATQRQRMLDDGLDHLIATMDPAHPEHLWQPGEAGRQTDPLNVQHGAAGVLGVLTRAYRNRPDPALREAVTVAAEWIHRRVLREPRMLPGLHFGRPGTAWALAEAGVALDEQELVNVAADLVRRVPLRWPNPDVCHGIAGAGLAQVRLWEITGDDEFLTRTRHAADLLVDAAARRDGRVLWPIPRDFASNLAGEQQYGFAHGVAGVGAFLLVAARVTGEQTYFDVASEAADTLVAAAQVSGGAAYWSRGPNDDKQQTNWCNGSSGVATFLIRMWQDQPDDRFIDLARQAAVAIHRSRWHTGLHQCHGLAGDAEFLMDLADIDGQQCHRTWATDLADAINLRHTERQGRAVVADDGRSTVSAAFNTGLAGIVAFLLRLRDGGPRMWLPETLSRPARQQPALVTTIAHAVETSAP